MKIFDKNVEAIADLIAAHTTTLVFANTRKMTENIVLKLRPYLGDLVAGHHGSMDKKSDWMLSVSSNTVSYGLL